jgi:hypothetical protein
MTKRFKEYCNTKVSVFVYLFSFVVYYGVTALDFRIEIFPIGADETSINLST